MFISLMTRPSSSAIGAAVLRATVSIAWGRESPALSAFESRLSVSGSWRLSAFSRLLWRNFTYRMGKR
jgi:hypothetical protein